MNDKQSLSQEQHVMHGTSQKRGNFARNATNAITLMGKQLIWTGRSGALVEEHIYTRV